MLEHPFLVDHNIDGILARTETTCALRDCTPDSRKRSGLGGLGSLRRKHHHCTLETVEKTWEQTAK